MKFILFSLAFVVTSCQALNPAFFAMADNVLRDVVSVSVDKEAFEGDREVHIHIDIEAPK